MAHYRVLMTYKDTEDPWDIIAEHSNHDADYGDTEPFGFDYMSPLTEPNKVSKLPKDIENKISGIIKSGEELYYSKGILCEEMGNLKEALKSLDSNDSYIIYDIHL